MRHGHVPVTEAMIAAWLRCMSEALRACDVDPEVRAYLEPRLGDVARHLRNRD
jgi:truncated hemoglobin YjbI